MTAGMTHATIKGVYVGIDADGWITIPDADGRPDELTIGRVERYFRIWKCFTTIFNPGDTGLARVAHATRREAIEYLLLKARVA